MPTEDFVARDHELERGHERATEQLAEHRWHWTLDQTNADRVPIREYARRVGRGIASIHRMAHGFEAFRNSGTPEPGGPVTLTDFIEQANLGAEKAEATQAVAAATGKSFSNVAASHRSEVRSVLSTAQDRAERKGTRVEDEVREVAQWRERSRKAADSQREQRRSSQFMLVELEGHIGAAIRRLREALSIARDVDFDAEQVEMLEGSLDQLRSIVGLIDVRITGRADRDWDDEFTKIMEGQ
jgi:hypothetical protein